MTRKNRSVTASKPKATFAGIQRGPVEFDPDYTHTKKDLKRIAILACAFFVVLIALSFFLH